MVGICYSLPNQDDETDEVLFKQLGEVFRHYLLFSWRNSTSQMRAESIMQQRGNSLEVLGVCGRWMSVGDGKVCGCWLLQHLNTDGERVNYRRYPSGLVGGVTFRGCLGLSDHEITEFSVLGEVRRWVSRTATLNFHRADFGLFRRLNVSVP